MELEWWSMANRMSVLWRTLQVATVDSNAVQVELTLNRTLKRNLMPGVNGLFWVWLVAAPPGKFELYWQFSAKFKGSELRWVFVWFWLRRKSASVKRSKPSQDGDILYPECPAETHQPGPISLEKAHFVFPPEISIRRKHWASTF